MKRALLRALAAATNAAAVPPAWANDPKATIADPGARLAKIGAPRVDGTDTAGDQTVPALLFGDRKIDDNHDVVDGIRTAHGATATVFVKQGDEFVRASWAEAVASVRRGAENVATASGRIAQGNRDLSSRTEQQASALQHTAATMDELGTTVRTNAAGARQANPLAMGASEVARRGGEVVERVVETMSGVQERSRQIGEIITVIDVIAFQTDILAPNAAVDAARAGEQGRGFAVVAGGVRSLAQRSPEAARQIKDLIGTSVSRAEQGTGLVGDAGRTMAEIVESIQRVTDIVGEISTASAEQSSGGVAQVGEAVTQIDRTTQQNAALVEESAAAADSLSRQAEALVQAVGVFRLARG